MKVLFVAGFGPIVRDREKSRSLYNGTLGIDFKEEDDGYLHTEKVDGCKAFALWPLAHAANQCFGTDEWPDNLPIPQSWLEFDVDNLEAATEEMLSKGHKLLVKNREEPWGQKVTRFLDPDGVLVAITYSPWLRGKK